MAGYIQPSCAAHNVTISQISLRTGDFIGCIQISCWRGLDPLVASCFYQRQRLRSATSSATHTCFTLAKLEQPDVERFEGWEDFRRALIQSVVMCSWCWSTKKKGGRTSSVTYQQSYDLYSRKLYGYNNVKYQKCYTPSHTQHVQSMIHAYHTDTTTCPCRICNSKLITVRTNINLHLILK